MLGAVKISVVVPIYNPGKYVLPNIESMLAQTLPKSEYEVIYVNDGATDETPALLDALSEEHENVRVHHQENSGWPGKPRNVGVDLARGEFVQFVDQDDTLSVDALDRLYRFATKNNSDIVLSRFGGTMATGPNNVFRHHVDTSTIDDRNLNESLTPHKLFRREFLIENNIRFAEGKRRLEDQLFMMEAYLVAKNISVLAGEPSYFWWRRDDGKNTSGQRPDRVGYYNNLREVLDVIVENTEEGELRNRLLRRHYRVEMLGGLKEPRVLRLDPEDRRERFDIIRELALERFSDGSVQKGMDPMTRLRAHLLEAGDLDGLITVAERGNKVKARTTLTRLQWEDDRLVGEVRAEFTFGDESPLVVVHKNGSYILDPRLTEGLQGAEDGWEVPDPLAFARAEPRVHDRENNLWWFADDTFTGKLLETDNPDEKAIIVEGAFTADPLTIAGDGPMIGSLYDVWIGVEILGFGRGPRLATTMTPGVEDIQPALLGDGPLIVAPYWTKPHRNLSIDAAGRGGTLLSAIAAKGLSRPRISGGFAEFPVPVVIGKGAAPLVLEVTDAAGNPTREATIERSGDKAVLKVPDGLVRSRGPQTIVLRLPGTKTTFTVQGQWRAAAKHRVRNVLGRANRLARRVYRRLPSKAQALIRRR